MSYTVRASDLTDINLTTSDTVTEVLQNIATILSTRKGTVPLLRDFGMSQEFLDRPIEVAKTMIFAEVKEAIDLYEPRAEIVDMTFETDVQTGRLIPAVEVIILE